MLSTVYLQSIVIRFKIFEKVSIWYIESHWIFDCNVFRANCNVLPSMLLRLLFGSCNRGIFVFIYVYGRRDLRYKYNQWRFEDQKTRILYLAEIFSADSIAYRCKAVKCLTKNFDKTCSMQFNYVIIFRLTDDFSRLYETTITILFTGSIIAMSIILLMIQVEMVWHLNSLLRS